MKILVIGNDPHDIAGVANYTRPLAEEFAKLGHRVSYFYSGAWNKKYDWLMKPYLKIWKTDFPFECAEVINSPNWKNNFGVPLLDMHAPQTERLFQAYLEKVDPDVVHVHSRMGLPASLLELAFRKGISVFNTIHVYGLLCQRRVMIDSEGDPCNGPSDFEKCTRCTGVLNIRKLKFAARVENTSKSLLDMFINAKKALRRNKRANDISRATLGTEERSDALASGLGTRFNFMIDLMNEYVTKNICVSSDVKHTLMRFGVQEDRLMVQHIGSVIAESQVKAGQPLHRPLVIGNIGGVAYYKGTHVLLDAVSKLRNGGYVVKIFGKYDEAYIQEMMKGREDLPVEFLGRYKPEDLPEILRQIDIMVLPSICNDTAPQTIFESYSSRIPIIASDIGGFPDFIKDRENGLLFKPGDSDDLADKIETILGNSELLAEFSSKIPRLKTIAENAHELLSLYEQSVRCN